MDVVQARKVRLLSATIWSMLEEGRPLSMKRFVSFVLGGGGGGRLTYGENEKTCGEVDVRLHDVCV